MKPTLFSSADRIPVKEKKMFKIPKSAISSIPKSLSNMHKIERLWNDLSKCSHLKQKGLSMESEN